MVVACVFGTLGYNFFLRGFQKNCACVNLSGILKKNEGDSVTLDYVRSVAEGVFNVIGIE